MNTVLKFQKQDSLLRVILSDESSRNAFSIRAARELRPILHRKDFDALIFSSEGRVFCSGGNLDDYASMPDADLGRRVNDEIREVLGELASLDRPTIAAVNGDAFGGGLELMSCFDLVLATPHAMFALWQRKIGLSYGWGGGERLEKRLGPARLKKLSLAATAFSAREALQFGLIDQVVQESVLMAAAASAAKNLASLPKEPLTTLKKFEAANEADHFNKLWWNESHKRVLANRKKS